MIAQLRSLFRYRLLIHSLVGRELKARYRGSVLGFLWSFINPLLMLLVYGIVFGYVLVVPRSAGHEPYFVFLFCGLLPWSWFQASIAEASGSLIAGGNLIKKVLFPAEVLPVVCVLTNLAQLVLALPILLLVLVYERKLGVSALLLPLPVIVQLVFTLGLALLVSALTVHFRDIQSILAHVLHLWFFATPVIYAYTELPAGLRRVFKFNPLTHLIVSYQQMLFDDRFTDWRGLAGSALAALLLFALGSALFDRLRDTLAEEV
jgi:ABC-type polysaccharide/polyol phosphate export permease